MKKDQDMWEQSYIPSPSPCCVHPLESNDDNKDDSSDTGNPKLWDAHAGMKPSWLDVCASDGKVEIKDNLPHGGAKELNRTMINMMLNVCDYDKHNNEWLPPKEQNKLEVGKKGISVLSR